MQYSLFRRRFVTSLNKIEIDLTTKCSLACKNCDRNIRQAPSNESISLEQVKKFYKESIDLNWKWDTIGILGGEPTLHPELLDILDVLYEYKKKYNDCTIELITNGYGSKVKQVIDKIPDWVTIRNSQKKSSDSFFVSVNVAPIDLRKFQKNDFSMGCVITSYNGIGLNRYGYYPCGASAALDRVFGLDLGLKSLADVNDKSMNLLKSKLCKYCGYFKYKLYDLSNPKLFTKEEKYSITWEEKLENYKVEKPTLKLY